MSKPWTICPECGRGRGEDHRPECQHRRRPQPPDYSGRSVADIQTEVAARPHVERAMLAISE